MKQLFNIVGEPESGLTPFGYSVALGGLLAVQAQNCHPAFKEYGNAGICSNLKWRLESDGLPFDVAAHVRNEMMKHAREWPEFSGNDNYPVPAIFPEGLFRKEYQSEIGYSHCDGFGKDRWNPEHPYGAARIRLLQFLIDVATEKAKEQG